MIGRKDCGGETAMIGESTPCSFLGLLIWLCEAGDAEEGMGGGGVGRMAFYLAWAGFVCVVAGCVHSTASRQILVLHDDIACITWRRCDAIVRFSFFKLPRTIYVHWVYFLLLPLVQYQVYYRWMWRAIFNRGGGRFRDIYFGRYSACSFVRF